jgi:hypothetical protein
MYEVSSQFNKQGTCFIAGETAKFDKSSFRASSKYYISEREIVQYQQNNTLSKPFESTTSRVYQFEFIKCFLDAIQCWKVFL